MMSPPCTADRCHTGTHFCSLVKSARLTIYEMADRMYEYDQVCYYTFDIELSEFSANFTFIYCNIYLQFVLEKIPKHKHYDSPNY